MLRPAARFLALALLCAARPAQAAEPVRDVILATTTSTQDTGLLDRLVPMFEQKAGFVVKTIAVGSGQAVAMGRRGEADVLLVHSPEAEAEFMAGGFGAKRALVMHNDFVLVGPASDPAKVRGAKTAVEALQRIAAAQALCLSRGDNSGTHAREKALWAKTGVKADGEKWYQQTGLGMGQTLNVAAEKKGYALTDRGTFLALRKTLGLELLVAGDAGLLNVYHVITVSPDRFPKVNARGAAAFADFIVSPESQAVIGSFGADKYGAPLFTADAGKSEVALGR